MVAALLPLLIGSSVGPEAGLTGIIVGLCYWAGDNLKFAKQNTRNYSQIGAAVSMSVLFHAPLFGIFEVEENSEEDLAAFNKGVPKIIYLRNRAGCRHWYLCRFICTFWCRAFRISIL
mgnify:CR=1 FL=1